MAQSRTELPQRLLAQELRAAIDDARRTGRITRVVRLLKANPKGSEASAVRQRLGAERIKWLEELP